MRRSRTAMLAIVATAAVAASGCGSEDLPNEPRAPSPIELTARVDDRSVSVDPAEVGAGMANITIANLGRNPVRLTFSGPTETTTETIGARGGNRTVKLRLEEGDYEVVAEEGGLRPGSLIVGPERETAQNELLLP